MSANVVVIDYGLGNLLSVVRAFENCGAKVIISSDANEIMKADKLVLPGVGAFANGMLELNKRGLVESIQKFVKSGKPLLGICLGMQLLFSESDEFGLHKGLDLLSGRVLAIPKELPSGKWRKIPHIGWNELIFSSANHLRENSLLAGIEENSAVYFIHSYAVIPEDPSVLQAVCNHEEFFVSAIVQKGSIFGCQFHPEKSGSIGLAIIKNFLQL